LDNSFHINKENMHFYQWT